MTFWQYFFGSGGLVLVVTGVIVPIFLYRKNSPKEPEKLLKLARYYHKNKEYPKAIECYQEVVDGCGRVSIKRAEALLNLGNIHGSLKQYEQAIPYYKESLAILNQHPVLYQSVIENTNNALLHSESKHPPSPAPALSAEWASLPAQKCPVSGSPDSADMNSETVRPG